LSDCVGDYGAGRLDGAAREGGGRGRGGTHPEGETGRPGKCYRGCASGIKNVTKGRLSWGKSVLKEENVAGKECWFQRAIGGVK